MSLLSRIVDLLKVERGEAESAVVAEAKAHAKEIVIEAEEEARHIREKVLEAEKKIAVSRSQLEAKAHEIEDKAKSLRTAKEVIERKQTEIEGILEKQKGQLEKVASMSKEEARKLLLENLDKDLVSEKAKRIRVIEDEIKKESDLKAQEILIDALSLGASDVVVDYTTSKIKLPDEDLKGRIIGKEGRNIRSFEELTGVDLDLDSSPGEIVISSFDSVRREVARLALERLIADGRIQPARIEEIVEKTKKEIDHQMYKAGDDLCHKVGIYNLSAELVQMLGRFKYRFSYGQNMIEHTLEVTRIGVSIAHALNANVDTVKLGCLLHDVGKVVADKDGSHVELGVEVLRKFGISTKVLECVNEHHNDHYSSIESAIVALADHVSGSRPGSRSEDYESYVQRMKALEDIATSFDGVEKAYAVSAGREVRVFVSPERVDDDSTALIAREIAKKIELEQTYPGIVKVVVIRETRVSETAK